MTRVLNFPEVHNFLLCPKCDNSSWFICWPKDKDLEWYIECYTCGQQYDQGLITGLPTKLEKE